MREADGDVVDTTSTNRLVADQHRVIGAVSMDYTCFGEDWVFFWFLRKSLCCVFHLQSVFLCPWGVLFVPRVCKVFFWSLKVFLSLNVLLESL